MYPYHFYPCVPTEYFVLYYHIYLNVFYLQKYEFWKILIFAISIGTTSRKFSKYWRLMNTFRQSLNSIYYILSCVCASSACLTWMEAAISVGTSSTSSPRPGGLTRALGAIWLVQGIPTGSEAATSACLVVFLNLPGIWIPSSSSLSLSSVSLSSSLWLNAAIIEEFQKLILSQYRKTALSP